MRQIVDIHIHSKFSRATSRNMILPNLYHWARLKGIDIIGTGDFTHPKWLADIETYLEPNGSGLFDLKKEYKKSLPKLQRSNGNDPRFILSVEISCIYSKGNAVRRVHMLVCVPDLESAKKINKKLATIGNLSADGRPILGLDAKELLKICSEAAPEALVIPAHAWTPWFSVFGSKSGFDSLEECFEDLTSLIPAIETGLSSDPAMNWRVKALDGIALISNSDAHSLKKLGREATLLYLPQEKRTYQEIARILREKDPRGLLGTIEFFPEEGKYHYDGHRQCGVYFEPKDTKKKRGICPKCARPLTIGVLHRVDDVANRPKGEKPSGAAPFRSIVPLDDILAEVFQTKSTSKKVDREYQRMTSDIDSEFNLLLEYDLKNLHGQVDDLLIKALEKVRQGSIYIQPGYDGVYGKVQVFSPEEKIHAQQTSLFEMA